MARRLLASAVMLLLMMAIAGCAAAPEQLFEYVASADLGGDNAAAVTSGTAESDQTAAEPTMVGVLVDRLNVRSEPGADSQVVGKLFAGDLVEQVAASEDGEWLQVVVDGLDDPAWIAAAFAEAVEPARRSGWG